MTPILQSTLICPQCGNQATETMPTHACLYFYTCTGCNRRLAPRSGECCVFCSYGSVPCPPIQMGGRDACRAGEPKSVVPEVCSLQPGAFHERVGEIGALMRAFGGVAERMPEGVELHFKVAEGVRAALESLAEKERSCCAMLEFTVREQAGSISFCIAGQPRDRLAIDDLAARLDIGKCDLR